MSGQNEEPPETPSLGVSSLRSLFENKKDANPKPPFVKEKPTLAASNGLQTPQDSGRARFDSRVSLDVPRPDTGRLSPATTPQLAATSTGGKWGKMRPLSMGHLSPPRSPTRSPPKSPFLDTIDSPTDSPPRSNTPTRTRLGNYSIDETQLRSSRSSSPTKLNPHFSATERTPGPSIKIVPTGSPSPVSTPRFPDPRKANEPSRLGPAPPPVNRAAKPLSFASKTPIVVQRTGESLIPQTPTVARSERNSPFSTPPSESDSPLERTSLPPIPTHSKPSQSDAPSKANNRPAFEPAPAVQRGIPPVARQQTLRNLPPEHVASSSPSVLQRASRDTSPDRPNLPPRRENAPIAHVAFEPPPRRSVDDRTARSQHTVNNGVPRASMDGPSTRSSAQKIPARNPPQLIRRVTSETAPARSKSMPMPSGERPPPPARPSLDTARPTFDARPTIAAVTPASARGPSAGWDEDAKNNNSAASDFPDSSQVNRRPPRFKGTPLEIATRYDTKLLAVCGDFCCTTGYVTRVWDLVTGDPLLNISHGEHDKSTVKATAVAFKPAQNIEDEGKRIWLGFNTGDMQEIDVPSRSVVASRSGIHGRAPVQKIVRQGSNMWSIDEEGKWLIWLPDESGSPSISVSPDGCRIPAKPNFLTVIGTTLWAAYGKEIQVFQYDPRSRTAVHVTAKPLVQHGVGEVTSAAIISSKPDQVYVGHVDGKCTIYSRHEYSCLGIVNVSQYKIVSLAGAGDYLWASYYTGMIYVYDTSTTPWRVKKDWQAHRGNISGLITDRSSIWKSGRLQVLSLGQDNAIQVWDGMLKDDWLENDLHERDQSFCQFDEVSALVMTWNAGASKPKDLRNDERDRNFFRDLLLKPEVPPDILVFGFQELVDLEDKKITAKSLFKGNKKKDTYDQEHMSHQYRAWKDELTQQISNNISAPHNYHLVHTANLVGLFTCIFVKTSVRHRLREVKAAEVKLGMGGLHGNKGALLIRFAFDDSSLCFINCHLAAGQKETRSRHNNVAAIMEAAPFPAQRDSSLRSDLFVSGGDGSMVLDHEICILNGDLNYRIDSIPRDKVVQMVRDRDLTKLLDQDQLLKTYRKDSSFRLRAFKEMPITFPPTYKYDVGTDRYDSSEKKRSPAWCDRILYRGVGRIKQLDYRRHEVHASDHRPVSGLFTLRVRTIDQRLKAAVRAESEGRFEEVTARIGLDIKLDYLTNVLGLSSAEAKRSLQS